MKRKDFVIQDGDKEVMLSVRNPLPEEIEEADKIYAGKIASLIRESGTRKPLLRQELSAYLESCGVWTKEDEAKIDALNKEIDSILSKLKKGGIKLSEGRQLAIDVMDKRKEIIRVSSKRQVFDDSTIESIAELEKSDYFVYTCTVYADSGEKYWASFEDMKLDKLSPVYFKARNITFEVVYGVNQEFEKRLPENRWLKKYNFIDEELNYIDRKTGEKVTRDGKLVKEIQEDALKELENLQGEIKEEEPFIDDETNEPILVENTIKQEENSV